MIIKHFYAVKNINSFALFRNPFIELLLPVKKFNIKYFNTRETISEKGFALFLIFCKPVSLGMLPRAPTTSNHDFVLFTHIHLSLPHAHELAHELALTLFTFTFLLFPCYPSTLPLAHIYEQESILQKIVPNSFKFFIKNLGFVNYFFVFIIQIEYKSFFGLRISL